MLGHDNDNSGRLDIFGTYTESNKEGSGSNIGGATMFSVSNYSLALTMLMDDYDYLYILKMCKKIN